MRVVLGVVGVGAALYYFETGVVAILLVLCSLAYVAWTTGRGAGVGLAAIAGCMQLLRGEHQPSVEAAALTGLWFVLYLAVVVVSAAIEAATRPEP
jgi:hypothetical protein